MIDQLVGSGRSGGTTKGNWLVTGSRDQLLKLFDLSNLSEEVQVFRMHHKKEASTIFWHPVHEGPDEAFMFCNVGTDREAGRQRARKYSLAWHPLDHSCASDRTVTSSCSGKVGHGLEFANVTNFNENMHEKKILCSKPISRNFQVHQVALDDIRWLKKVAPSAIIVMQTDGRLIGWAKSAPTVQDARYDPSIDSHQHQLQPRRSLQCHLNGIF